jgi:hypothetical protein
MSKQRDIDNAVVALDRREINLDDRVEAIEGKVR